MKLCTGARHCLLAAELERVSCTWGIDVPWLLMIPFKEARTLSPSFPFPPEGGAAVPAAGAVPRVSSGRPPLELEISLGAKEASVSVACPK